MGWWKATKYMYTKHLLKIGEVLAKVGSKGDSFEGSLNYLFFGRIKTLQMYGVFFDGFGPSKIALFGLVMWWPLLFLQDYFEGIRANGWWIDVEFSCQLWQKTSSAGRFPTLHLHWFGSSSLMVKDQHICVRCWWTKILDQLTSIVPT